MNFNYDYKLIQNESKYMILSKKNKKYFEIDSNSAKFLNKMIEGKKYTKDEEEMYIFYCKKGILIDDKFIPEKAKSNFNINRIILFELNINDFLENRLKIEQLKKLFTNKKIYTILFITFVINILALLNFEFRTFSKKHFELVDFILIYIVYFIITVLHELGHAIVCKVKTTYVGNCGCMLYFLIPTFFTDVTVMKILPPKERKDIILAGVFSQNIVGSLFAIYILFTKFIGYQQSKLIEYCFIFNILMIILNLFPLLKFDGHWYIEACLGVEDLYGNSIKEVLNCFTKKKHDINIFMVLFGSLLILFFILKWLVTIMILHTSMMKWTSEGISWFLNSILICMIIVNTYSRTKKLFNKKG